MFENKKSYAYQYRNYTYMKHELRFNYNCDKVTFKVVFFSKDKIYYQTKLCGECILSANCIILNTCPTFVLKHTA